MPDAAPDARIQHVTRLHLDRIAPGAMLQNFPVPIVLDDTRADRFGMSADASDLRVTDATNTALAIDIEQAGAPSGAPTIAWVRLPEIEDTSLVLEASFGNASVAPTNVWSDQFEAVWHGDGSPLRDASGNNHVAMVQGTAEVAGAVGPARAFVAAAKDYAAVPDGASLAFTTFTAEAWVNPTTLPGLTEWRAAVGRQLNATPQNDFFLGAQATFVDAALNGVAELDLGTLATGQWHHIAMTYDTVTLLLYLDGVMLGSSPIATGPIAHTAHPLYIGADCDSGAACPDTGFWDGALDEIRLSHVVRSPEYLAYEVAAMRDQVITYALVPRN